jgi:5-methylcytosine-specific restriction endonuclease McrA
MDSQPGPNVDLLLIAQLDLCFYCGGKISFDRSRGWLKATRDHFYPISGGGSKGFDNVVLACQGCNNRKRARQPRLIELLKWNKLAAVWPHIKAVDLESLAPKKACRSCGQQIPCIDCYRRGHHSP